MFNFIQFFLKILKFTRKEGDLGAFSGANSVTYQQKLKRNKDDDRHPLFKRFRQ